MTSMMREDKFNFKISNKIKSNFDFENIIISNCFQKTIFKEPACCFEL